MSTVAYQELAVQFLAWSATTNMSKNSARMASLPCRHTVKEELFATHVLLATLVALKNALAAQSKAESAMTCMKVNSVMKTALWICPIFALALLQSAQRFLSKVSNQACAARFLAWSATQCTRDNSALRV